MLTHLQLRNFKAWEDTGTLRLAPLTILFGANSAGKSSLGQGLLLLKQTVLAAERRGPLRFGGEHSLVDLGSFADCLHRHELQRPMGFGLGWQLPQPLLIEDPLQAAATPHLPLQATALRFDVTLQADAHAQPQVERLAYTALAGAAAAGVDVCYARLPAGDYRLHSPQYGFATRPGAASPLPPPDKFHRVSEQARACFRNADVLADLAAATEALLLDLQPLGPLRETPRRLYAWSGDTPESVGARGEHSIAAILAATEAGRCIGHHGGEALRFDHCIAAWLQRLGIIERFSVQPVAPGRREVEVLVHTHGNPAAVKLTDVGFGVAQVLPAIVQAFYAAPHSTVWMEQPELHLHPQVQAEFADLCIAAVDSHEAGRPRQVQLVIESHSEHFLNRLQRRIAEGRVDAAQVAVYFCRRQEGRALIEPLQLDACGEIANWPPQFFGDEMGDIAARTLAALQRKRGKP